MSFTSLEVSSLWTLFLRRLGGRVRRHGRGGRAGRAGGRAGLRLLLVVGVEALAESLDLGLGADDRRLEARAAVGDEFELLARALALALEAALNLVAHGRGVERADERGAALD